MAESRQGLPKTTKKQPILFIRLSFFLAIIGLVLSIYSWNHHLEVKQSGSSLAACNMSDTINCDDIAKSEYSEFMTIPMGAWGSVYFLTILALLVFYLFNSQLTVHLLSLAIASLVGLIVSFIMAAISYSLGLICIVCVGIYFVTFLQIGNLAILLSSSTPHGLTFTWDALWRSSRLPLVLAGTLSIVIYALNAGVFLSEGAKEQQERTGNVQVNNLGQDVNSIPLNKSPYSNLGEDYRKGGDQAKVIIHEFSDFQCPACRSYSRIFDQLAVEYKERILIVFKNYPLDKTCNSAMQGEMHEFACAAASFARCAGQYGHFWEFHDRVYEQQASMSMSMLQKAASDVGLTKEHLQACQNNKSIIEKIKDDIQLGQSLGVNGTPAIFINGRKFMGSSLQDIKIEIEKILNGSSTDQ